MSEIRIDKKKALSLLSKAVKKRGKDYVYKTHRGGCVYTYKSQPDCMVGQALADAGVPIRTLSLLNRQGAVSTHGFQEAATRYGITLTPGALKVFKEAQWRQDTGSTWGTAYDAAKAL